MKEKFLKRFTIFDLILLALMAGIGVAVKPVLVSLCHIITGPLLIPGGAFAGGFYMMFLVIGAGLVQKRGSASLIGLIQAILVIVTGIYGTHGIASILTYAVPGLAIDILWLLMKHKGCCMLCCFFGCITANVSGILLVNLVFFRLPLLPLLLAVVLAVVSGGIGGIVAWNIIKPLKKYVKA